jgi:hypothetical protein
VPVNDSDQTTLFQFSGGPFDMSNAEVHFRMRTLTPGEQLIASPFAVDADGQGFAVTDTQLRVTSFPEDTWVDVQIDFSAFQLPDLIGGRDAGAADSGVEAVPGVPDPADFDASRVTRFGLQVGSTPAFAGQARTVIVLVDTVSFQRVEGNPLPEKTFNQNAEGMAMEASSAQAGSELLHYRQ